MYHIFHSLTKHSPDLQRPAKSPQPLSREPISLPPPRQDNGNATQVLLLENQFRSTSPTPKCIKLYYNYNHLDFYSGSQRSPIPSQVHFRQAARHQSLSPPGSTNKSVPAYYPSSISSHCTQTQEPRTIKPVRTLTTKPMLAIYPNIKLIATWKWFSPIRHQNISHATPGTGLQAPFSAQKFHTC